MNGGYASFHADADFSRHLGRALKPELALQRLPGAIGVEIATPTEDRQGTDWWVNMASGDRISIDVKSGRKDHRTDDTHLVNGLIAFDRLLIEETSQVWPNGDEVIGWTHDLKKRTDYILYFWEDTGRSELLPFHLLCAAAIRNNKIWRSRCYPEIRGWYKCDSKHNEYNGRPTYRTDFILVPRVHVWDAMKELTL